MARNDPPLVTLRKATRKLAEVQRNLAECSQALDGAVDDLVFGCIALKEQVIARYEAMGGTWADRATPAHETGRTT